MARYSGLIVLAFGLLACSSEAPDTTAPAAQVTSTQNIPDDMKGVPAKRFFGHQARASAQTAGAFGSYAKGCMAGGARLPETGPTWQAMRLNRNRNWGHPETIDFIRKLSRFAATQPGWNGLYVGDISQPRGGPMLTGHRSHQLGLDADIWLRPASDLSLSEAARESLSAISMRRVRGAYTNNNWTRAHHEILKAAAQDPRTERIFIFPGAKVRMCEDETGTDRDWLRKIRPWWGHHYHFHVRLKCPEGSNGCENQAPPPPGDGCDDAREWVANILDPPPPDPDAPPPEPRPELQMKDLPRQCVAVLQSE